jgi:hypothetical protein
MERKTFLASAAAIGAALAGTGIASAAVFPTPSPTPSGYYRRRGELGSARSLQHARRSLERIIDALQHDQTDYNGYRVSALNDLVQARGQLDLALQWDATHPNSAVSPKPQ